MKLAIPKCPECGCIAYGTVDKVVAQIVNDSFEDGDITIDEVTADSEFENNDQTDLDNQTTITNDAGESLVVCENGHEWYTAIEE